MTWKLCACGGRQGRRLAGPELKERFSLQTLPEAAQSVKGPEEQLALKPEKSECIAWTKGPNAAGIQVVAGGGGCSCEREQ